MKQLSIANYNITRIADDWSSPLQSFTSRFINQLFNINFSNFMSSWNHPDTINCCAAIYLCHEIKTMDILVKIFTIPMRHSILMPRNSSANSWLFNKEGFIEWSKIFTIDGLSNF